MSKKSISYLVYFPIKFSQISIVFLASIKDGTFSDSVPVKHELYKVRKGYC